MSSPNVLCLGDRARHRHYPDTLVGEVTELRAEDVVIRTETPHRFQRMPDGTLQGRFLRQPIPWRLAERVA